MIRYTRSLDGITAEQLAGGFFAGWPTPPSPEMHRRILRGATHVVLALDGERVIGFVTALSDGVLSAYIPLLEVLPAYQGRGVGTALLRELFAALGDLYMIDLQCDASMQPFYARLGMQPMSGMALRNYAMQNGERAGSRPASGE